LLGTQIGSGGGWQDDVLVQAWTTGPLLEAISKRPDLVDKMTDSEKTLLEAISKLSKKFDVYDKRLTSMGSDVSRYKPKWIC
jgi:hypothetical protein